ncbi:hypothetical protein FA09DRAFT_330928 [Tilletiopsis washingtonensis]|uniref:Uncharacterized protein n=1 Tax=Tilletiopsis washingtonensis TaxID=58919 RepID=A0A316Z515_9BASI|nr:hypothetical protein FA09DRAFT_330928 [Tilletiopsis washingtonensis]PWN96850.1 hypothetical protein FA09DRAFT_330928 [Tilletiopsis washingtonensis]
MLRWSAEAAHVPMRVPALRLFVRAAPTPVRCGCEGSAAAEQHTKAPRRGTDAGADAAGSRAEEEQRQAVCCC